MTDDLKARLDALHVWPQAVADAYAAELTPRQIDKLYAVGKVATEAADRIATLEAALADMTRQRDAAMAAAEAQAEARGMRKAADRAQEIANAAREVGLTLKMGSKAQIEIMERCWGAEDARMAITTLADATEAAAKGGV